jgi:hypothetical protein
MGEYHHHPDGTIYVRTAAGSYRDTPENLALDFGVAPSPLPPGITERIYNQGARHALMNGHDVVDGGPMPWPEGDAVIAAFPQIAPKSKARADALAKEKAEARMNASAKQATDELRRNFR